MKEQDLYWLAGLLEGEGYFAYNNTAQISLQMTDKDVVERVAKLFHGVVILEVKARSAKHKPTYICRIHGQNAVDLMKQLLPLMGLRRQAKINQVIERHENRTNVWSNKRKLDDTLIGTIKGLDLAGFGATDIAKTLTELANMQVTRFNVSDVLRGITGANIPALKLPDINPILHMVDIKKK